MKTSSRLFLFSLFVLLTAGFSQAKGFRTIVIDAGHGGRDLGGTTHRVYEKHLALDTASRLQYQLKKRGYRTVMTRQSDRFISLSKRAEIANRYRNSIFVSIHYNYTWKKSVSGLETFYYSKRAKPLAQLVQKGMLRKVKAKNRGAKFARYYVLRNSRNPAILVEGGFVSNSRERQRMKSGSYRNAIAKGIANGIDRYQRGRKRGYYH